MEVMPTLIYYFTLDILTQSCPAQAGSLLLKHPYQEMVFNLTEYTLTCQKTKCLFHFYPTGGNNRGLLQPVQAQLMTILSESA